MTHTVALRPTHAPYHHRDYLTTCHAPTQADMAKVIAKAIRRFADRAGISPFAVDYRLV